MRISRRSLPAVTAATTALAATAFLAPAASAAQDAPAEISLISDDNFSATQFTRVLNLAVKLP